MKKIFLFAFVAFAACALCVACSSKQKNVESDEMADSVKVDSVVTKETKFLPIGAQAYYGVFGPVKSVEYDDYSISFNEKGQSPNEKYTSVETEDSLTRYVFSEEVCTYDQTGRLVEYAGGECLSFNFKYDENNRLISYEGTGADGDSQNEFFYDEDGNCIKRIFLYENPETITYKILEKDSIGNWTKRKSSNGDVETRKITYWK